MSAPLPPVVPDPQTTRPSKAVTVVAHTESVLNYAISKLLALMGCAFFGYLTVLEAKSTEPSNVRLALGAVPAMFCLAMLCTDQVIGLVSRLSPFIPAKWRGGNT